MLSCSHIYARLVSFKIQLDFKLSYNLHSRRTKDEKLISFHWKKMLPHFDQAWKFNQTEFGHSCSNLHQTHHNPWSFSQMLSKTFSFDTVLWQWFTDHKIKQAVNPVPYMEYLTTLIYQVIQDATKVDMFCWYASL